MQEFLIILRGDGLNHLSPDELQQVFNQYKAWVEELGDQYIDGQRLQEHGSLLMDNKTPPATDGPFLEPKEMIAGFFLIRAENLEQANMIAQTSPHLGLYSLEVRPLVFPKMG